MSTSRPISKKETRPTITLIESNKPITVEQLLTALQEAIKIDPTIATKRVLHENPLSMSTYNVDMKPDSIFISSKFPFHSHCSCCDCSSCEEIKEELNKDE